MLVLEQVWDQSRECFYPLQLLAKNKSKKIIETIEHLEKLKNLEQQKKESNIINFKDKKKFKKKNYRKKKFFKKVK